jgi:hypothetical protein
VSTGLQWATEVSARPFPAVETFSADERASSSTCSLGIVFGIGIRIDGHLGHPCGNLIVVAGRERRPTIRPPFAPR